MIVETIVLNIMSSVLAYDLNMVFIFNVKGIFLQTKKWENIMGKKSEVIISEFVLS